MLVPEVGLCYNQPSSETKGGIVRRATEQRNRIVAWVISVLVVLSMALSMAGSLVTSRRRVTPTALPSPTTLPTETPTPGTT